MMQRKSDLKLMRCRADHVVYAFWVVTTCHKLTLHVNVSR